MKPSSIKYSIEVSLASEINPNNKPAVRDSDVVVSRTSKRKTADGNVEVSVVFSRLRSDRVDQIPLMKKHGKIDSNQKTVSHYRNLLKQQGLKDEKIDSLLETISFADQASFKRAKALRPVMQRIQNDEAGIRGEERTKSRSSQKTLTKSISVKKIKQAGSNLQEKAENALSPREPNLISANLFEHVNQNLIKKGALQKVRPPLPTTPSTVRSSTTKSKPLPPTPQRSAPIKPPSQTTSTAPLNLRSTIVLPELPDFSEDQ